MLCPFGGNLGLFSWERAGFRVILGAKCPFYFEIERLANLKVYFVFLREKDWLIEIQSHKGPVLG